MRCSPQTFLCAVGALLLAALAALARPAAAVDGVIEINQARAMAGGITAGDGAGFPVSINASGSYRLTGNLTFEGTITTAIEVSASDVEIDLNGFSIAGGVTCTLPPTVTCLDGEGSAIRVLTNGSRLRVHHGSVSGMANYGISASNAALVLEDVELAHNGGGGVSAGDDSLITRVNATNNGGTGIVVNSAAEVRDSVATLNGAGGITSGDGAVIEGNRVMHNVGHGIYAGSGTAVIGNTAYLNTTDGIVAWNGTTVFDNSAYANAGYGIHFNGAGGYARNVLRSNHGGDALTQVNGGAGDAFAIQIGTNVCGTDTTCP